MAESRIKMKVPGSKGRADQSNTERGGDTVERELEQKARQTDTHRAKSEEFQRGGRIAARRQQQQRQRMRWRFNVVARNLLKCLAACVLVPRALQRVPACRNVRRPF